MLIDKKDIPQTIAQKPIFSLCFQKNYIEGFEIPLTPSAPIDEEFKNKILELRKSTGAGLMYCKKAIFECDGDIEKAIEYIRNNSGLKHMS